MLFHLTRSSQWPAVLWFVEHHAIVRAILNLTFWTLLARRGLVLVKLVVVVLGDLRSGSLHLRVLIVSIVWTFDEHRVDCIGWV